MSSLTMCSGQGGGDTGKGNEKECVVEDIGNKSSHSSLPCHLGYFHGIKLGILPPIKYCPGGCLSMGNIFVPLIISLPNGFLGTPSHQLFLIGCPSVGNALPSYFPFRVPIPTTCNPYLTYPLLYVPINSQYI